MLYKIRSHFTNKMMTELAKSLSFSILKSGGWLRLRPFFCQEGRSSEGTSSDKMPPRCVYMALGASRAGFLAREVLVPRLSRNKFACKYGGGDMEPMSRQGRPMGVFGLWLSFAPGKYDAWFRKGGFVMHGGVGTMGREEQSATFRVPGANLGYLGLRPLEGEGAREERSRMKRCRAGACAWR